MTSSAYLGVCEFCSKPVMGNQRAAYRVRGWELERAGGGANHIAGKERQPDRVCHVQCVEVVLRAEKRGLRGQMELS